MLTGGWIVVTPARNEAERLESAADGLAAQAPGIVRLWVVVDDGSDDGTADLARSLSLPFPLEVVRRMPGAGLTNASEWSAFLAGARRGLERVPDAERVMKLDADVCLDPGYLAALADVDPTVGLTGGRLRGVREREQAGHVRGALKAYNRPAFEIVAALPAALGWDVMDAVAVRGAGHGVRVVPTATAVVTRRTGSSEGLLSGRHRGGTVSRWVGYHPVYLLARLLRYTFRRPYVLGAVAMAVGYLRAGPGPWPDELKALMRREQADRLRALTRSPVRWLRATYGDGGGEVSAAVKAE